MYKRMWHKKPVNSKNQELKGISTPINSRSISADLSTTAKLMIYLRGLAPRTYFFQ